MFTMDVKQQYNNNNKTNYLRIVPGSHSYLEQKRLLGVASLQTVQFRIGIVSADGVFSCSPSVKEHLF